MAKLIEVKAVNIEESIAEERRLVCNACEFLENDICTQCGCLKESKIYSECPVGNW